MNKATAWILPITPTVDAAVGELELVHLLPEPPPLFGIPGTPDYCRRVLVWQDRIVPLMDLAERFAAPGRDAASVPGLIGVFAYRPEGGGPTGHGALLLRGIPWRLEVGDDQACPLPAWLAGWAPYAGSCFQPEGPHPAVPILRLGRVFAAPAAGAPSANPDYGASRARMAPKI